MRRPEFSDSDANAVYRLLRKGIVLQFKPLIFYFFLGITVLVLFMPFNPRMPARGLDASWQFAMNEAVAQHMGFGTDVVFTYGPYASICTQEYHPATFRRMMWGSLLLAISYFVALIFLSEGQKPYKTLFIVLFLATFKYPEILLLSYSFLLVACALKAVSSNDLDLTLTRNWRQLVAVVVMWSALGILPLIKGSLLLPFAASVGLPSILLLCHRRIKEASFLFIIPVVASVALWCVAGQSPANLPTYMIRAAALTSGYTEAMSTSWAVLPSVIGVGLVVMFLTASAAVCWSIVHSTRLTLGGRWTLVILCFVFLLLAFKHGFIATSAISSAFCSAALCFLIIALIYVDRLLVWSLTTMILLTSVTAVIRDPILTEEVHEKFGIYSTWSGGSREDILRFCVSRAMEAYYRDTYRSTWNTYKEAWDGAEEQVRKADSLEIRFEKAKAEIRSEYALPALDGTADFYEYDQSALLATSNKWDPRPVIQSYSAYTPDLAQINERHLRGMSPPEWVLFDLQSIGGRLPSLDDGSSWPALLDNYSFTSYNGRFVLMHKNPVVFEKSEYDGILKERHKTGELVSLPETGRLLFAEVDLKPTLAGRLMIALFNPPQLRIMVQLGDGTFRSYKVISEMMTSGFLVSPLVSNTGEFASLAAGRSLSKDDRQVKRLSIAPSYGGSIFWSDSYTLTLMTYRRPSSFEGQ